MAYKLCTERTVMGWMFFLISTVFLSYLMIVAYLYFFQRSIIYVPDKVASGFFKPQSSLLTTMHLVTPDQQKISVWHHLRHHHQPIIIYFHGNAGNLKDREDKFYRFIDAGFNNGQFSSLVLEIWKNSKVVAFDPSPINSTDYAKTLFEWRKNSKYVSLHQNTLKREFLTNAPS